MQYCYLSVQMLSYTYVYMLIIYNINIYSIASNRLYIKKSKLPTNIKTKYSKIYALIDSSILGLEIRKRGLI